MKNLNTQNPVIKMRRSDVLGIYRCWSSRVRIENTQHYLVGRVQSLCGCEGGRQSDEGQNKKMFFLCMLVMYKDGSG